MGAPKARLATDGAMGIEGVAIPVLYLWGVFGSVAVEAVAALAWCEKENFALPARYRQPAYLTIRLIIALCAGMVPIVLDAQSVYCAFYLGASAPLFLDRLAKGVESEAKG